ncbi:lactase-phlorizin hydrolase-like [Elysia marginata]|uniref:Lactase-phlorizin hydrolase-like n=1 Tax=Elysia marginata TaxID=1093978 RepID=A0AAV4JKA7_9GAST|nr:lactase-phlorizin hydrolase-like [Elysia marginata]
MAPGRWGPGTNVYIAGHNLIKAHTAAYRLYNETYRVQSPGGKGQVGISLRTDFNLPKDKSNRNDEEAAERGRQFQVGWFASPLLAETGDYPQVMKTNVNLRRSYQDRLPEFSEDEKTANFGATDFLGLNYYTSKLTSPSKPHFDHPSYERDMDIQVEQPRADPRGLGEALRWIKTTYDNVPVYITENGVVDENGTLEDVHRVTFFRQHLNQVLKAIKQDHCDVRGFVASSLLDSFTGVAGYSHKFGLFHVDFSDKARSRSPKASALALTNVIRDNGFRRGYRFVWGGACGSDDGNSVDVNILKKLGVSHYSFYFSWSRLMPKGNDAEFEEKQVKYYNNLINELRAHNIE